MDQVKTKIEYKELHDDVREGPLKDRSCTNCFCLLLFAAFLAAIGFSGFLGYKEGNPSLVLYLYDSSGNQCGKPDSTHADFKYLYFVRPTNEIKLTVCVEKCPDSETSTVNCKPNDWVTGCDFKYKTDKASTETYTEKPYSTVSWLSRVCVPNLTDVTKESKYAEVVSNAIEYSSMIDFVNDIVVTWTALLAVFGAGIVISALYLVFLRYFLQLGVYLTIIACEALLVFFGLYLWWYAQEKADKRDEAGISSDPTSISIGNFKFDKQIDSIRAAAIGVWVLAGIFALVTLCMWKRIELSVAIMKSAALFLKDTWGALLVPIVIFAFSLAVFAFWIAALVFLYTAGEVKQVDKYSAFPQMIWEDNIRNCFYFMFVSILWINAFLVALSEFIIAGAVCFWYYDYNRQPRLVDSPIASSTKIAFVYHLGSIAYGSLILSVVILFRWILTYIARKLYNVDYQGNKAAQCMCGCLACCVKCFEKFVEYLNKNAYTRIALTGESFCDAARNSFLMIFNNAARFAILGSIGEIFSFLGKVFITCLTTYLGYLLITRSEDYSEVINNPLGPTLIFLICSYLVSSLFMSVYDMACDAIIICFISDEELHKQNPVFAPEPLKEFMEEHREGEHGGCC
jgi:hypothetical protein